MLNDKIHNRLLYALLSDKIRPKYEQENSNRLLRTYSKYICKTLELFRFQVA